MLPTIWACLGMYFLGVIVLNHILDSAEEKDELDMEPIFIALQWPLMGVRIIFYMLSGVKKDDEE